MLQNELIQLQLEELECMENCDLDSLLEDLAENQKKIKSSKELYYDQKQDEVWIEHYYCNITMNEVEPKKIIRQFQKLITKTHKYKHPYYISKNNLYTWVDLQPNGELKGIYSGEKKVPIQAIEEDFETIQKRFRNYRELKLYNQSGNKEMVEEVMNVARQHRFNTEHVVPQSWFNAGEPMKGDLHHLFVCEPHCNSARSNFPYFDFRVRSESPKKFSSYCGTYETGHFEPKYGKGAVARATLYFLLRYPGKIKKSYQKKLNISLLKQWHDEFSVDIYEKHRNQAIFEIQGNRNPFIDFPELINKISLDIEYFW